jgi:hypothetical protein
MGTAVLDRPETQTGGSGGDQYIEPAAPINDDENNGQQAVDEAETHIREYARTYEVAQGIIEVGRRFQTLEQRVTNPMRRTASINSGHIIMRGVMPIRLN